MKSGKPSLHTGLEFFHLRLPDTTGIEPVPAVESQESFGHLRPRQSPFLLNPPQPGKKGLRGFPEKPRPAHRKLNPVKRGIPPLCWRFE